jgi:serine/threonine protein kinase
MDSASTPFYHQRRYGDYLVLESLGRGSFGEVFKAFHRDKDPIRDQVALKVEKKSSIKGNCLRDEYDRYMLLQSELDSRHNHRHGDPLFGLPKVHEFFHTRNHNVLVLELLGHDLETLFRKCGKKFSLKTVLYIGMQLIQRIERIHEARLIHRDIKPQNFMTGRRDLGKPDRDVIHIIDFGLAKEYTLDGLNHIPMRTGKSLVGTARYVSIRTHEGFDQSRRDDLEAIGYLLMYFLLGENLPWHRPPSHEICGNTEKEKVVATYQWIGRTKKAHPPEILCQGLPDELRIFMEHVKDGYEFHDKPKYQYLSQLLETCFWNQNFKHDNQYDWDQLEFDS